MQSGLILEPVAGRLGFRSSSQIDEDELTEHTRKRTLARHERHRALVAVLGVPIFFDTILLPLSGQPALGPARDLSGREIRWSVWAPQRKLLLDRFKALPPKGDLEAREQFAKDHSLLYRFVPPGWRISLEDLKELLK